MIQERVRAGLARARGEGKRLGRPPIAPAHPASHDDRHARGRAQMAGEIEPGLSRHHGVEDQQVEAQPLELGARVGGRLRGGDAVAFGEQEAREQRADAAIIVDHQQMGGLVGERGGHEDMHALRSREGGCFLSCKLYGQTKFSQQPLNGCPKNALCWESYERAGDGCVGLSERGGYQWIRLKICGAWSVIVP
jgi:hypothetical protein